MAENTDRKGKGAMAMMCSSSTMSTRGGCGRGGQANSMANPDLLLKFPFLNLCLPQNHVKDRSAWTGCFLAKELWGRRCGWWAKIGLDFS
jgi:hypothetical protein